jgi:hypothetical protein
MKVGKSAGGAATGSLFGTLGGSSSLRVGTGGMGTVGACLIARVGVSKVG